MNLAVLGAGSFGTTLANILAEKKIKATLWSRSKLVANEINNKHTNQTYLGEHTLSPYLFATSDMSTVCKKVTHILWAIPTQAIRSVFEEYKNLLLGIEFHINVAKGIEVKTTKRVSEIFQEFGISADRYCLLSGPSHAEEIIKKQATAITTVSTNKTFSAMVQKIFSTSYFRVYTNSDLIGSELSGAFKNVVAIASGICDGFGLGDNAKAALITRSLSELSRLVTFLGGEPKTLTGLTGLGDLIATCYSKHSRNRYVGEQIGKGKNLNNVLKKMKMIAEGVQTCRAFHQLKKNVEMPLVEAIYQMMFHRFPVKKALDSLMNRSLKTE